jgi:hypothetical protein
MEPGMGTEVLHLNQDALDGAYQQLVKSKAGFDQAKNIAEDIKAAIGKPADLGQKVTDFAESWAVHRKHLSDAVGNLSEKLDGISKAFDAIDKPIADALESATEKGKASGGTGSSGATGSAGSSGSSGSTRSSGSTGSSGSSGSSGTTGGTSSGGSATPAPSGPTTPPPAADGGVPRDQIPGITDPQVPIRTLPDDIASPGAGDPAIEHTTTGTVPAAAVGGAAAGVGGAAALGSLFKAWSGRSAPVSATSVPAGSRAALAQEFRTMGSSASTSTSSQAAGMSRGSVASLVKGTGTAGARPGFVGAGGLGHGGGGRSEPGREKKRREQERRPFGIDGRPPEAETDSSEPTDEREGTR